MLVLYNVGIPRTIHGTGKYIYPIHLLSKSTTIHVREVYQSRPMDTTPSLGYMVDVPPFLEVAWRIIPAALDLDTWLVGRKRSLCLWITIQTGMILQVETPGCSGFLPWLLKKKCAQRIIGPSIRPNTGFWGVYVQLYSDVHYYNVHWSPKIPPMFQTVDLIGFFMDELHLSNFQSKQYPDMTWTMSHPDWLRFRIYPYFTTPMK